MAITRTRTAIAHTSWNALAAGSWAGSALHNFLTTGAHDAVIYGAVDTGASGATAGDTIDIYLVPFMEEIGAARNIGQGTQTDTASPDYYDSDEALTEGAGTGEIKLENLILAASLTLETTADAEYYFVFGVVATLGYMPDKIGVVVYNGITTNAMGSDNQLEVAELTYA
jgi:hypothetical protein